MLDYSSWFRNLDLSSFVIIQDLVSVSISNGERRRVISPWAAISSAHLNSSLCTTGHIYCFSTDSNRCSGTCSCWPLLECLSLDLNHTPHCGQYFRIFLHPEGKKINLSQRKFIPSKIHVEELRYTVFQECLPCSQHHQAEFIVLLWTRPTKGGSSHFKNRWCSHWNLDELINLTTWTLWKGWSTV